MDKTFEKKGYRFKYLIILIYFLAFIFFVFKMFFYSQYVGRFPDEIQHISYIAYIQKEHTIIPNFKDMRTLEELGNAKTYGSIEYIMGDNLNYLGHPPLYYQIMSLSRSVHISGNIVTVNILRLRYFNMSLGALAMLLILYIGYTRIGGKPLLHLLYASIVISVPMLAYGLAGINNDTLSLIGVTIFILALIRFSEKKRNFNTYFLISLGVFVAFMAKLTAGLIVFISLFVYLILVIIKEKNAWFLISKKFLVTLPMYLIAATYYILVHIQTGSILPTFKVLDPTGFYKSSFYVEVAKRSHLSFSQYSVDFLKNFFRTWTGIASGVSLTKVGRVFSLNNIALLSLLFIPIILIFQIKRSKRNSSIMLVIISVYFGLAISAIAQWLRAYNEYVNVSGFLGGYQSRYYLCGISAIGLCITFIMKNLFEKTSITSSVSRQKGVVQHYQITEKLAIQCYQTKHGINLKKLALYLICSIFICMLIYEDFIYFLINFKQYL